MGQVQRGQIVQRESFTLEKVVAQYAYVTRTLLRYNGAVNWLLVM